MTPSPPTLLRRVRSALTHGCGSGTLLHGPAGCGKSSIARGLAEQLSWPVIFLDVQWQSTPGGTEALLHSKLQAARAAAPCVLVIDELHALAPAAAAPGSIEVRLALQLADGLQELRTCAVFTLGICREPDTVHASVRRSGRLHHALAIRAPSAAERADILEALAARLLPDESSSNRSSEEERKRVGGGPLQRDEGQLCCNEGSDRCANCSKT